MISFETSRFGRLEVGKDKIIHFPEGLIGFNETKRFIMMDYKDTFLKWLQSVDNPDVAFIIVPAMEFFPDFNPKIEKSIMSFLEAKELDDIVLFTILRVDDEKVTANLQGPLIINTLNKKGVQVVNEDSKYSCRTPLDAITGQ